MDFFKLQEKHKCVIIGNCWDALSAIVMQKCGFHALGTTSWGVANTLGYNDGERITFSDYLHIIKKIKQVTDVPLSIDIESGFSDNEDQIVRNILILAEIGCCGVNIEDANQEGLKNTDSHTVLIEKIRAGLNKEGYSSFFINARIDTYLKIENPLLETIIRAKKYEKAGASGIFVPCLKELSEIEEVSESINIPLNIMSLQDCTDINALKKAKVRRFSFGNAMSDAIISHIETLCNSIQLKQSTAELYNHEAIKIKLKD